MLSIAEQAERALRMVRESKYVSYDTETSGVDWRIHAPIGYVIGAPRADGTITTEDVCYIPIRHGGGGNIMGGVALKTANDAYEPHPFEVALADAFDDRNRTVTDGRIVGHNIKFDVHMSANAGIRLGRRLACTQNMAAMVDEYARKYGLEVVADRVNVTAKKTDAIYKHLAGMFGGQAVREQMANFWKTAGTDPIIVDYAVGDGVTTWEVFKKLDQRIEEEEMRTICDIENDIVWTCFRMERAGMKVDLDRVDQLRAATEARIKTLLEAFPTGFNTRSPLQMRSVMEDAGLTDWPLTEKGAPSFTEKWLKRSELGRSIIEIRRHSNLIASFINPLVERHVFNGRVHATLNQLKNDDKGTISGRFSCSDPNLQQVAKRVKEIAIPFRRLFVADEGRKFFEYDWSQAEPRLFAHYSGAAALLEGYNSTPFKDMHTVTAELLGVERDPTAKRMGMGILTGMQSKSLADHMGCPESQAQQWMAQFFGAYPEIKDFQSKAKARLLSRGYVYTILGRRCRLEDRRFAYRGTSKIIQGSQADMMKKKILDMDMMSEAAGDVAQLTMTIHDSIEGQRDDTPEGKALLDEMVRVFNDVQSDPFNLRVPFVAEGQEGDDWAEATFGAEKVAAFMGVK